MMKIKRICEHCKKEFETKPEQNFRHCSKEHFLEDRTYKATSKFVASSCWNWSENNPELATGKIASWFGKGVHYMTCRNPYCVNPEHMEFFASEAEVTQREIQHHSEAWARDMGMMNQQDDSPATEWKPKF